jgi:MFS family permease
VGWLADKYERRGIFNISFAIIGIIGFLMLAVSNSVGLSYFAVFLGAGGMYPCIANTITWVSNNCDGVYRRGITIGGVIAWGNMNGGKSLGQWILMASDVQ